MIAKIKDNKEYIFYFIAVLAICFLFPYSWDDWAWGSHTGIVRLHKWFDNYSGRYVGNLIVLVLTRSTIIRSLTCATCLAGIVYILGKLTKSGRSGAYLSIVCLVLMPLTVFRESIVWTSGFSNFVPSILLTLIYIYCIRNIYDEEKPKYSIAVSIAFFILGIINTLIVEHLTLYNVLLSIYVIVYTFIRHRKVCLAHILYFVGCIAGTVYMFTNPVYNFFVEGNYDARKIETGTGVFKTAIETFFRTIVPEGFLNNLVLNVLLALAVLLLWKKIKNQISKKAYVVGSFSVIAICVFAALSIMRAVSVINNEEYTSYIFPVPTIPPVEPISLLQYVQGAFAILFMIGLVLFIIIQPLDRVKKTKLLFIPISIACIVAPLLVVTPVGGRCFFATYILFIWLLIEFYKMTSLGESKFVEKNALYFRIVIIMALLFFAYIFGNIFAANQARVDKARADIKKGKKTIYVKDLPHPEYVHGGNPVWDEENRWNNRFKAFYGLDKKVRLISKHKYTYQYNLEEAETTTNKKQ